MQRFFFLLIPILMAIMVFFFYGEAFPEKSYNRLIHEKSPFPTAAQEQSYPLVRMG
ncbi:MAG: hypothetical protein Ct9H300mP23_09980 [Nitrospinota bacterium]|nr:MAG: hypothetical protein Ct9H300mP23_09980 [Nitrospinota bacterium]